MFQGDEKAWKSGGDMCDPDKEVWFLKLKVFFYIYFMVDPLVFN